MMSQLSRRAWVAVCAAAPLAAAEFWRRKEFPDWSQQQVTKLLTDSPWARSMTVTFRLDAPQTRRPPDWRDIPGTSPEVAGTAGGFPQGGSPVGGIGAPNRKLKAEANLTFLWSSALPIRQATALTRFGRQGLHSPAAKEVLQAEKHFYVLEILGLPALIAYMGAQVLQDELYRSTALVTKSGRIIRPESLYVALRGGHLSVTARFPRDNPLTVKDDYVDFLGHGGPFRFNRRFKLKAMIYHGRLEL